MKLQSPKEIVNIDGWDTAPEYAGYFQKGSKEKMLLYCPEQSPFSFLVPNLYYMYKLSPRRYPHQCWLEIAAYYIGESMNVPVPPAFIACSTKDQSYGVLIEWFYGAPDTPEQRFVEGGDYMKKLIAGYDSKKGEQHNFRHIEALLRTLSINNQLADNWQTHWAKVFTFDAVIGNRDRHHENRGIIWTCEQGRETTAHLSPAYDNESSLGHEILEAQFPRFDNSDNLLSYINHPTKATHHMHWTANAPKSGFAEMVLQYVKRFPDTRQTVLECLSFDVSGLAKLLRKLSAFEVPNPLTKSRIDFMVKLIEARKNDLLGKVSIL